MNCSDDVLDVISQMIKSVDSVEGSTETGFVLPHIHHWGRLVRLARNVVVTTIVTPPAVAAVAVLTVVGAVIAVPVFAYRKVAESVSQKRLWPAFSLINVTDSPDVPGNFIASTPSSAV
ncbi:hypothetical protein JVU11DRAFT_10964 [Chiua virens]|nr:hypothetical protein JVU11DRAFT_10964 [Chiua virens]